MVVGDGRHWRLVSQALADLLGHGREAMERGTFSDYVHPGDMAAVT